VGVAARALVLCAVVARAYLEEGASDPHTEELRQQIRGWLEQLELGDALTAAERRQLERPVGRLSQREQVDASWLCEGLAVLAFALGQGELPLPDAHVDPRQVAESLGFLRATPLRTVPTVRPEAELALAEARLNLVRDRLAAFAREPVAVDLEALARGADLGPLVLAGLPLQQGDLRVDGHPLVESPEERWRELLAAAEERARCMAWIRGTGPLYAAG
jgi:hypothetical protein